MDDDEKEETQKKNAVIIIKFNSAKTGNVHVIYGLRKE